MTNIENETFNVSGLNDRQKQSLLNELEELDKEKRSVLEELNMPHLSEAREQLLLNDLTEINEEIQSLSDENLNFWGRNKARRLKRLIRRGKMEKAQKLLDKIQKKVDRLAEKGKLDRKKGKRLTDLLALAKEKGLTVAQSNELGDLQDEIDEQDEIDKNGENDKGKIKASIIPNISNWIPITLGLVIIAGICYKVFAPKKEK